MSGAQAELDAMDELQRASNAPPGGMSADERAAIEMQAAMDAERAERAAKAAAASASTPTPTSTSTATSDQPERLCLAVRTSLLSEFRNSSGVLQAFDVCHGQTTFGVLCGALSRMPGVEFPEHDPQAWFRRPSRFTFHGQLYEVSIPHENIRVCPVNKGLALIEMEELLEYVRHNVLRSRASRYTVR